jgi:hypothetical protein
VRALGMRKRKEDTVVKCQRPIGGGEGWECHVWERSGDGLTKRLPNFSSSGGGQVPWLRSFRPTTATPEQRRHCCKPFVQPRDSTTREEHAAFDWTKTLVKEGKVGVPRIPKWILWALKLILVRLECVCVSPGPPKRCTRNVTCQSVRYKPLT